jgi:hypothetical protein
VWRKRLTFEQAEGAEPLPTQLKLREISHELRARLWSILFNVLRENSVGGDVYDKSEVNEHLSTLLYDWHVIRQYRPADSLRRRLIIGLVNSRTYSCVVII